MAGDCWHNASISNEPLEGAEMAQTNRQGSTWASDVAVLVVMGDRVLYTPLVLR